jgi:hypothetical protein
MVVAGMAAAMVAATLVEVILVAAISAVHISAECAAEAISPAQDITAAAPASVLIMLQPISPAGTQASGRAPFTTH